MRLAVAEVRARRAAEPSEPEPEEATEPVHHEHSHTEHQEHPHPEHHPGHDYNHMKEKFMNELGHLPSKLLLEYADTVHENSKQNISDIINIFGNYLVIWEKESTPVYN